MAIWSIVRAEGIPIWVTLLAVFSTVISFYFGIMTILDPTSAFGKVSSTVTRGLLKAESRSFEWFCASGLQLA